MEPKGTLVVIGGNEKKKFKKRDHLDEEFILPYILDEAGGASSRVEIITTASDVPDIIAKTYRKALSNLETSSYGFLDIRSQEQADNPQTLARIKKADAIMFSGGDQSQISRYIIHTKLHKLICDRFEKEEILIAGTSAGAMAMSEEMITGGRPRDIFTKNTVRMGKGLGLMKDIIFDTHFIRRHRFGRLAEAIASFPDKLGVGLGEDTALVIKDGNVCEVIGSGMVIIFDGSHLSHNKHAELKNDVALSLVNLTVHVLAPQDKYYIHEKKAEIYYDPEHHIEKIKKSS